MSTLTLINNGTVSQVISAENIPVYLDIYSSDGVAAGVSNNTVTLQNAYTSESIYRQFNENYKNICSHNPLSVYGSVGYYISKLNGIPPIDGNVFIVGGNTTDIYPAPEHGLLFSDFGQSDIDCLDYYEISQLINRLSVYLDNVKKQIICYPSGSNAAEIYGVHQQYQSTINLWNYLVQILSLRVNASYQNKHIFLQAGFINNTPNDITANGMVLSVNFNQYSGQECPYARLSKNPYVEVSTPGVEPVYLQPIVSPLENESSEREFVPLNALNMKWRVSGLIPSGATTTVQLQFELSPTRNKDDVVVGSYFIGSQISEYRVRVTNNLDIVSPTDKKKWVQEHNDTFVYFYDGSPIANGKKSAISRGKFRLIPRGSYTDNDVGSYIITMLEAGQRPVYRITDKNGVDVTNRNLVILDYLEPYPQNPSSFAAGDKFVFSIQKTIIESPHKIQDGNIKCNISWSNLPLTATSIGDLSRNKSIHIIAEEDSVGKLEASLHPIVNVEGMTITGPAVEAGELSIGTVDIGTVDIGTVNIGTVNIGTVDIGTVDIGTVNIGTVNIGTVDIGSVYVGSVSIGTVVLGSVSLGEIILTEIKPGKIIPGAVIPGKITVIPPIVKPMKVQYNTLTVVITPTNTK